MAFRAQNVSGAFDRETGLSYCYDCHCETPFGIGRLNSEKKGLS